MEPRPPVLVALYVPGDRPDRFAKALSAGADQVILDLEDAVAPGHKAEAREAVAAFLSGPVEGARGRAAERGGHAVARGGSGHAGRRPVPAGAPTAQDRGARGCRSGAASTSPELRWR